MILIGLHQAGFVHLHYQITPIQTDRHSDWQSSVVPGLYCVLIKIFVSWFLTSKFSNLFYFPIFNFFSQCFVKTFYSNSKNMKEFDNVHLYTHHVPFINILLYFLYQIIYSVIHLPVHLKFL